MADVKIIDIDNKQWNMKDQEARNQITEILNKLSQVFDIKLGGNYTFNAKMKYFGEDENYIYYNFWWEPQDKTSAYALGSISITPPNTVTDKILYIDLNCYQYGNAQIYKGTQHAAGTNSSGIITYLFNATVATQWTFSGMGILRRQK